MTSSRSSIKSDSQNQRAKMLNDQHIKLVDKISKLTRERKIEWKKSIVRIPNIIGNAYQVSIGNASIRISTRNSPSSTDPDYIITILNGDGEVVESFSDVDLNETGKIETPFKILQEMYATAGRIALGADIILNDLLGDLDDFDND